MVHVIREKRHYLWLVLFLWPVFSEITQRSVLWLDNKSVLLWHRRLKPTVRHAGSFIIFSGIKHLMFVFEQLVWKLLEISCRFHSESRSRTAQTPRPAAHPLIQHPHYFSVSQNENDWETSVRRDKWKADCWSLIESIREMKRAGDTFAFLSRLSCWSSSVHVFISRRRSRLNFL